jgi:hypothetical protein
MPGSLEYRFTVTVPAGTTQAAPLVTATVIPPLWVRSIRWRTPRGSAGFLGFQFTMGGAVVFPLPQGTWIVADGTSEEVTMDGLPDSGAWQVTAYNTGAYAHSVYVTYYCDPIVRRVPPAPRWAPLLGLSG